MASSFKGNDRRPSHGASSGRSVGHRRTPAVTVDGAEWIWGRHAVEAALANPRRLKLHRLLAALGKASHLEHGLGGRCVRVETLDPPEIGRLLPSGAVHQGLALLADAPEAATLEELAEPAQGMLVVLDQVADPQNVGAIFRSAAAFGARGVILQDRRAPPLSGALAKAAAGAVDLVPCARVVNLSRALEALAERGWRAVGLAGEARTPLSEAFDGGPVALVLGSEGEGLRRLVSEHCDLMASIPMPGGFESLNVATAAAIALYEASRSLTVRA